PRCRRRRPLWEGRSGRNEPARNLAPRIEKDNGSHEEAEVRARHGFLPDLTSRASDQTRGGKQLFGSNDLVVARSEQEDGGTYLREIDRPSERLETAGCQLILSVEPLRDLKIEGAGQVDGARVPFAKQRDQPGAGRRGDVVLNLQQATNGVGFERRMFPHPKEMRAADASVSELDQLLERGKRRAVGDSRQLGFACIDVDR